MRRVVTRFERDEGCSDIEVTFVAAEEDDQVKALMERVRDPLSSMWEVRDASGASHVVEEGHIVCVATDRGRLRVTTSEGTFWMGMPLQEAERLLNPSTFMRISRYEVVNLLRVRSFEFTPTGAVRVLMDDGSQTWVSRRFVPAIRARLKGRGRTR